MSESVVVVTGALAGIGGATAKAFGQRGDVVVISGRHDDVGEQATYLTGQTLFLDGGVMAS
jgi:NADP-dependent 3-hydroxy acid dehydrogenase YdfG